MASNDRNPNPQGGEPTLALQNVMRAEKLQYETSALKDWTFVA
jgi:hypothetical protein